MLKISISIIALIGSTQAIFVHDLDDEEHLRQISATGLIFSLTNREAYLKVGSNNGSTGYTWVIDHEGCDGIIDIV